MIHIGQNVINLLQTQTIECFVINYYRNIIFFPPQLNYLFAGLYYYLLNFSFLGNIFVTKLCHYCLVRELLY